MRINFFILSSTTWPHGGSWHRRGCTRSCLTPSSRMVRGFYGVTGSPSRACPAPRRARLPTVMKRPCRFVAGAIAGVAVTVAYGTSFGPAESAIATLGLPCRAACLAGCSGRGSAASSCALD